VRQGSTSRRCDVADRGPADSDRSCSRSSIERTLERFLVSHEEPENRHSVSGFLNETVDIFLAIRFLCGSRLVNIETSDPSLASTNTTNLSWLEGNVNLRGTCHRTGQLRAGYPFGIAGGQHSCTAGSFVCQGRANRHPQFRRGKGSIVKTGNRGPSSKLFQRSPGSLIARLMLRRGGVAATLPGLGGPSLPGRRGGRTALR